MPTHTIGLMSNTVMLDLPFFSRIYEKLMVHSDLSKAGSWMRLTEEFLNSPLPNTDGTKVWHRHELTRD